MNMWRSLRFENRNFLVALRDHFREVGQIRYEWFTWATAMWQVGASNTLQVMQNVDVDVLFKSVDW